MERHRLPLLPLIRCPELAGLNLTLPVAVILTRFFSPLWVFIFGIRPSQLQSARAIKREEYNGVQPVCKVGPTAAHLASKNFSTAPLYFFLGRPLSVT